MIKVSAGTANVLGLKKIKSSADPTTAYFLLGDKCINDCSFCSLSRSSTSSCNTLSRVTWPSFSITEIIENLEKVQEKHLGRICLQMANNYNAWKYGRYMLEKIKSHCDLPISVCCTANNLTDIKSWFDLGVQRFGLSLDAASERIFKKHKGDNWTQTRSLLDMAAEKWPGRITTHLIVGLGETDEEMISVIYDLAAKGIQVGLFAFTPVKGTRCEKMTPPSLYRYRNIQAAYYLIKKYDISKQALHFENGTLTGMELYKEEAKEFLAGGEAFRTTGCDMCNRPFYNERPGRELYNYPRQLTSQEVQDALRLCLAYTKRGELIE